MAYLANFFKSKRPPTSFDDLAPDNLEPVGSDVEVRRQLTAELPAFIWSQPRLRHHWCDLYLGGMHFVFSFREGPVVEHVLLQISAPPGEPERDALVQRVC